MSAAHLVLADLAPSSSSSTPFLVYGFFGLVFFLFWLWALIDVVRQPAWAFERAGVSRPLWLVFIIGSLFCGLSWLVAILYLAFPRSKLRNQVQLGRGPGFPQY